MADHEDTPTLSQLLYTHEKVENLARGPLSPNVVDALRDAAHGLVLEMGNAPAASWDEFHRKLGALLDDYIDVGTFMGVIREDVCRLALTMPEMAQAAE